MDSVKKFVRENPKYVQGNTIVAGFIDLEDFYLDHEE